MNLTIRYFLIKILNLILGIISVFIVLRVVLRLLGANPVTPFVSWIYSVSEGLIYPFKGIFSDLILNGLGVVDMVALTALVAYSLVVYLIISIIDSVIPPVSIREDSRVVV